MILGDIINEYATKGKNQGIRIESDVNCVVFTASDDNWKYTLDGYSKSIVFIDEDYHFPDQVYNEFYPI